MREKIYSDLLTDDNTVIKDPTTVDWRTFRWDNGYFVHYITTTEILKPYLISAAYYGSIEYEDIILLLNNIENPFDMIPEQTIYIPKLADIKSFIIANRK